MKEKGTHVVCSLLQIDKTSKSKIIRALLVVDRDIIYLGIYILL